MKRRKFLRTLSKVLAVVFALCLLVVLGSMAFPNKYPVACAIAGATGGVVLVALIVTCVLTNSPDKELKARRAHYSSLPREPITDFKAELAAVRQNFEADTDPQKNITEKVSYPNTDCSPYFNFSVLKNGKVYYAYLVEANTAVFKRKSTGMGLYPAVIVYGTDEYFEENPYALKKIAEYMFANRSNNILRDERSYFSNVKLENPLTEGRNVYMTTIFLYCPHLPFGYLSAAMFPVIAEPRMCTSVFVADSKYWTDGLVTNFMYNDLSDPTEQDPFGE
ncbi:MAG: CGLD27 family protein [Clostridia bacterium]|nr:CGLD27 family protein [Clostridia bacterium]